MAAYSTGNNWSFPKDLPGDWVEVDDHDDVEEPGHEEVHSQQESPRTTPPSQDEQASAQSPRPEQRRRHYPPRTCRICLEVVLPTFENDDTTSTSSSSLPPSFRPAPRVTYESPDGGRLLRPCLCKGSQKYVHEQCLTAWRLQDPLAKRNYWQCPTCRYKYHLQRLTWGSWISSTSAQLGLTLLIFVLAMFVLGFVADPIINMYLDPYDTITSAGGPTGSLIFEDEPASWAEHFVKGLASLGLLGFAKFIFTFSPFHWVRSTGGNLGRAANTGRNRLNQISWLAIVVGVVTFLYAVWKGVRAWSRRTLEQASERVMDVPGGDDDDEDEG